jgi:hypothetical protein
MTRRLGWWLVPVVLLVGVAGCGTETKEAPPPAKTQTQDGQKPAQPKDVKNNPKSAPMF